MIFARPPAECSGPVHRFDTGVRVCRCGKLTVPEPRVGGRRILPTQTDPRGKPLRKPLKQKL